VKDICRTLTEGKVVGWPAEGYLKSLSLLDFMFLYKILCYTWMPTNNVSIMLKDRATLLYKIG
jgi:hypothetical protein